MPNIKLKNQGGTPYGFDPGTVPGYIWHCHIVDQEDNKMIRPMIVTK